MWLISLFWVLRWIILVHLAHRADCGRFVTTAIKKVSYFQNVAKKNHLVIALKSETKPQLHLFNDTSKLGVIYIGVGNDSKELIIESDCLHNVHTHTSDLVTPTEYTWLWIRWTGTQIEYGTGKTPGVDLVYYTSFSQDIKYIGFAKYDGNFESHWIVGQTDELTNESVFKSRKNRRIVDIAIKHIVKTYTKCALMCLNLNGCYSFNVSKAVNGRSICELITKDLPTGDCYGALNMNWEGDIQAGWTNYYL
ncbi:hypothetical protein LOTGIDRAFT_168566 [Lottia gigantea]|uniref:Farnesoic acid O-methyl transferase domain-containing protein n=1 Tax=Lottia gigantea TaxID=225164 RepID=V3ZKA5_LOTGI|nr:hypothetical protein LOTGIDRAFT_168566 [Lottia gigantea]ESO84697.1 hypothetical protein LOTGIDRAFT_168566 [Lottia gigantea]